MCYIIERHRSCFHYMRPFTRNRLYFYLILVYISAQVLYNILYSITFKISFSRLFLLNILVCASALLLVTTLVFKYITRSLISVVSICSSVQLFLLRFLLFILKLIQIIHFTLMIIIHFQNNDIRTFPKVMFSYL